ncbi:MAG: glycosyltransferase family 2 protein [Anaerolineae bacterium]|nr:glycosyltransferase family 2 protein [Anaerolineae bacterium]
MSTFPRVTFGMIVLNGEPFVRYNLRALYPFAHEIIVVEGAAPAAAAIATPDGHSRDSTLETLRRFKAEEDPDDKLIIITRDGFWSEKDEMSQAYAKRATGDYLWQIDSDEFYHPEDMQRVLEMLKHDPDITVVSVKEITFWGGPDVICDGWYLRRGAENCFRVFKWGEGYTYVTHRPPTVHDAQGRDLRSLKWIQAPEMTRRGVIMYHYSLLLPRQVMEKCEYYGKVDWEKRTQALQWAQDTFMGLDKPFRVHNVYAYPSWLERFHGKHPPSINAMWHDLQTGQGGFELRQTEDVERLLRSPRYRLLRFVITYADYPARWIKSIRENKKVRHGYLGVRVRVLRVLRWLGIRAFEQNG